MTVFGPVGGVLGAVVGGLAGVAALAAPRDARAQNAAVVLELPASARALGLGGAMTAVGDDDAALFWNPAQVAAAPRRAAGLSVQNYLESTTLGALSGAARWGAGTVGIGVQVLSLGSVREVVPDPAFGGERGQETGASVSASDLALSLGYAARWRAFRVGAAAKLVRQDVAGESGNAVAGDIGAAMDLIGGRVTVAAAAQHIGSDMTVAGSRATMPTLLRAGAAGTLRREALTLLVAADVVRTRGFDPRVAGGAELGWRATPRVSLTARAGFAQAANGGDARGATFGGSVAVGRVALDYGYQGFDALGSASHRVGVRYRR
ncbi:MAG TPA: PorV/PorQ family protein [Gemmatimonadaceae bacterium]|nr:PorV/PorQ family protein [Gemmatimonadaceae bacterium]